MNPNKNENIKKSQYHKKKHFKSSQSDNNDVNILLEFKSLKDQNNLEAIAIWEEFQSTQDKKSFENDIKALLSKSKNISGKLGTSSKSNTAGDSTNDMNISPREQSNSIKDQPDINYTNVAIKTSFENSISSKIKIVDHNTALYPKHENKSKALLSLLKSKPAKSQVAPNISESVNIQSSQKDTEVKNKELKQLMQSLKSTSQINEMTTTNATNEITEVGHLISSNLQITQNLIESTSKISLNDSSAENNIIDLNLNQSLEIEENIKLMDQSNDSIVKQLPFVKSFLPRVTRNQIAKLTIALLNSKTQKDIFPVNNIILRPTNTMSVYWEFPLNLYNQYINENPENDLVIGLVRYGASINYPCIITKSIKSSMQKTNNIVAGKVVFRTPKSAGRFIYRLFDQIDKEKSRYTLGTSKDFSNELDDINCISSLKYLIELLNDQSNYVKVIPQFYSVIEGMKSYISLQSNVIHELINKIFEKFYDILVDNISIYHTVIIPNNNPIEVSSDLLIDPNNSSNEDQPKKYPLSKSIIRKLFIEFSNLLNLLFILYDNNPVIRNYISSNIYQKFMNYYHYHYCIIYNIFFLSPIDMSIYRLQQLTFQPSIKLLSSNEIQQIDSHLNTPLSLLLKELLPTSNFSIIRTKLCNHLKNLLVEGQIIKDDCSLALYGSSMNNFGNEKSDVDICIVLTNDYNNISNEFKVNLMLSISKYLTETLGMKDVTTITTARIPIVHFIDNDSGLECDLTFHNPLAIHNTALLRTYSEIDDRLRILGYIIKHWVKCRHMNSPADGTLSSYGYILCLIHFLQNRPVPILPNLQHLPSNWNGESINNINQKIIEKEIVETIDGNSCNVHYHHPTSHTRKILQDLAHRNKESMTTLLINFFHYFAYEFDYRNDIVAINSKLSVNIKKLDKAESDGWSLHDRLSIEDPFETWYDVAHVVKAPQMRHIRKEFIRAYTLINRTVFSNKGDADSLPSTVNPKDLIDIICEVGEAPIFSKRKHSVDFETEEENDHNID